jgi:hypothetical protein
LRAGELVLFPQGDAHLACSAPEMRAPADPAGYFECQSQRLPFVLHMDARQTCMAAAPDHHFGYLEHEHWTAAQCVLGNQ